MEEREIEQTDQGVADIEEPVSEENIDFKKKDEEIGILLDKLKRNMAEFDNYRKRTTKEKEAMYDMGQQDILKKFLPVIDNFDRAFLSETNKDSSLYKGIEMIKKQMDNILKDAKVNVIPCVGEKFNPNLHNAVMHINDSEFSDNEIIEEMQRGYMYKDIVLRPSMVKVVN
jgi:molecular chaperone GrpE